MCHHPVLKLCKTHKKGGEDSLISQLTHWLAKQLITMTQNLQRSLDSGQRMTRVMNNKKRCTIEFKSADLVVLAMHRSLSGTLWEVVKTGLVGSTLCTQSKGSKINSI